MYCKLMFTFEDIYDNVSNIINDVSLNININDILNVSTSDVTFSINDIPLSSNLISCDNANINDNTDFSNFLETAHVIDNNFNTVANNKYQIKDLSLPVDKNSTVRIRLSNKNTKDKFRDKFDNLSISKNTIAINKSRSNISTVSAENNDNTFPIFINETEDISCKNIQSSNIFIINSNNAKKNIAMSPRNKTYVCENTSNSTTTFIPLTQSTFNEKQLQYVSNTNNTESDNSIESEHNMDNSFHLSDCSLSEDVDEDRENTNNTNLNKTPNSTLNLNTSINSSRAVICDDRNMYVDTSEIPKNLKQSMCPYCKKLQKQFARFGVCT